MMKLKPGSETPPADRTNNVSAFSPLHRCSLSAIPFSWEQHPGIAKPTTTPKPSAASKKYIPKSILPRPPPMSLDSYSLSHIHIRCPKRNNSTAFVPVDPFELALAECAKAPLTPPGLMEEIWGRKMAAPPPQQQRALKSWRFGIGVNSGCNVASACSIVDKKVHVPRTAAGLPTSASCRILSHGRYM